MQKLDPSRAEARLGKPEDFTGEVTLRPLAQTAPPASADFIRVEFAPGARTHWHIHKGVQVLVVLEGRCRWGTQGRPVQEAAAGSVIHVPAGEKHWHGASADAPMAHLAINVALEPGWTKWLEEVSDKQYGA
jgi:quercetin dioxygenase-like cupin family protein